MTLQLILGKYRNGKRSVDLRRPEMVGGKTWQAGMELPDTMTVGQAVDALIQEHFRDTLP